VVGAGEADDGDAGVGVVVFLEVGVVGGEEVLLGVLAEEVEVVGFGDGGWGVVVEEVRHRG